MPKVADIGFRISIIRKKISEIRLPKSDFRMGFTLHELLIIITLIAILSTVGVVIGGNIPPRVRDSRRIADVDTIKLSLEAFYEKNNRYPFDSTNPSKQLFFSTEPQPWIPEIVTQGYSLELPKDPKQAAANPVTRLAQKILDALEIKEAAATHEYVPPTGMDVRSGSYVGNSQADHQIKGLGFQPELVIIKSEGNTRAAARTSSMPSGLSRGLVGTDGLGPNGIISLDNDGFTVGTDSSVNYAGNNYYYFAVADTGDGNFKAFSYTANGADDLSIGGCGFQPDMVIIFPADNYSTVWRTSAMTGDNSSSFEYGLAPDIIQALEPTGFQIGQDTAVNASGATYHAVCVKNTANIFQALPGYQGSAPVIPQQSINGAGFFPDFVLTKSDGGDGSAFSTRDMPYGNSAAFSGAPLGDNGIIALEEDGFRVGSDPVVNINFRTYYSIVWQTTFPPSPNFYYLYHISPDQKTYNVWATLENKRDPGIYDHTTAKCKDLPPIDGYNYCGGKF
jgi:type II secretory pathway pseudopilin PulG